MPQRLNLNDNYDEVFSLLTEVFGEEYVVKEWDVAKNSQDDFTRESYCPRIDYAIGPFNIDRQLTHNQNLILHSRERYKDIIDNLQSHSDFIERELDFNDNPRCFIAIEFENSTSQKHKLASIINSSAIGLLGIIVVPTENIFNKVNRLRRYLELLEGVGKISYSPNNVLIIIEESFIDVLRAHQYRG